MDEVSDNDIFDSLQTRQPKTARLTEAKRPDAMNYTESL